MKKLEGDCAKDIENLLYVQEFLEKYKKLIPTWGMEAIEYRAKNLAETAYNKVWKIN